MIDQKIRRRYGAILYNYVSQPHEQHLISAADLGRTLVVENIPLEEISEIHENALGHLAENNPDLSMTQAVNLASAPLMELLMAYGLAFREQAETRKRAEEALKESEQRIKNVVQHLPLATFVIDRNHQVMYWNKAMEELSGIRADDAIGTKRPWEAVHQTIVGSLADLLIDGEFDAIPRLYAGKYNESQLKDGIYEVTDFFPSLGDDGLWIRFTATALKDSEENIIGAIETLEDITDRQRYEESLRKYSQALEHSNKELETFAYVASHDLQEPLRMIASYVTLLARRYKGKLDDEADDFIYFAVDGAKRMQQLINDLLAYSRIKTRGGNFEPTNCNDVLSDALANLNFTIEDNNALITRDSLPTVTVDKIQIRQLYQNLISNAVKFRSESAPRVHVAAEQVENEWVFSVHDNGIGIDPQYNDRIFEVFQRLHGREHYTGTGIGLAICKKIVERHDGRIWVKSEPGKGSTFYFTIPCPAIDNLYV
jgi:PAS domain S-box-containing protein